MSTERSWHFLNPDAPSALNEHQLMVNRRHFFQKGTNGIGVAALAALLSRDGFCAGPAAPTGGAAVPGADAQLAGRGVGVPPHFAPKAKRVIYLFQNGAPTHVDLFDYKPRLHELHGTALPEGYLEGKRFSSMTGNPQGKLMLQPVEPFKQHGRSGAWVSAFLPYTAQITDELCFIKSMHTDAVNHAPAISFMLSGAQIPGRPTMGAWLTYGLGSASSDLPGFVVMTSVSKNTTCGQIFYDFYWGSGFLPSRYQGSKFRGSRDPVLYLSNPDGVSRELRRGLLDDLAVLNEIKFKEAGDPEIQTRISQYEMAYRMQSSVPDLTDLSDEPQHVLDLYGPQVREPGTFAYNCLIARRLLERGTRFVQLMHAGWDQHGNLFTQLETQCRDTDGPSAALVQDLKERGLLTDTLVAWGGEFGRTPFGQGDPSNPKGRDHFGKAYSWWLAGGGVKAGHVYGSTDDYAWNITADPVHIHDMQATIMHMMGIDHTKLTFRYQGRQFRLTDVHGHVVKGILA